MPTRPKTGNRLLDRLPKDECNSLIRSEKAVSLTQGTEVCKPDDPGGLSHVYFPTSGMVSMTVLMEDSKELEAATVGNEGMIGLPLVLGLDFSPIRAISQIAGNGLRVSVPAFRKVLASAGTLDGLLRRYTAYSLRSANQTIACNLVHSLKQRMCRWLLMCHDRVGADQFALTHEYLAQMLGVHRQTVSVAARELQRAGLLSYHRGVIRVRNRVGLEAASCECYGVTTTYYDRIMGTPPLG